MEKPEEVTRKFHKPDLLMLEQAQTMHDNFETDKPSFVLKFPMLADPYSTNWQTAIAVADALPSDEQVQNEIGLLTQAVNDEMQLARNGYQTLLVYLKLAYPTDAAVLKVFGQEMYADARTSTLKMIELMELAAAKANALPYKPALIAKGFTAADILQLKTTETDLRNKNKAQESAISGRALASQTRITALNSVWDKMVLVHDTAQVVFQDNFAKLQQYLLYPEAGPTPEPVTTALLEMITNQSVLSTVSVKIKGTSGNCTINWGDGISEDVTMDGNLQNMEHNYATPNNYTIKVEGTPQAITELFTMYGNITTAQVANTLTELDILDLLGNPLTTFSIPATLTKLRIIVFNYTQLTETAVNDMLVRVNNFNTSVIGSNISLQFGSSAAPTGQGVIAKAALVSRGWGVNTN